MNKADNQIIDRAATTIGKEDYGRLLKIHKEHDWLDQEYKAMFDLWCMLDDSNQKELIEFLIKNFSVINSEKLKKACKQIAVCIEQTWKLSWSNTYLTATCDDSVPDGSQAVLQNLKNKFSQGWTTSNFFNSLQLALKEISDNTLLLLVDDFIGTGDTIKEKLEYVQKTLKERGLNNVTVKIISVGCMDFAKAKLSSLAVDYFSAYWLKKGISELVDEDKREVASCSMNSLEGKLQKKCKNKSISHFSFGYQRSEALFVLDGFNVPDNVFPIFWWPRLKEGKDRDTLFRRL